MRTLLNIILGSAILLGFSQCGNSKETTYKVQEKPVFEITKATYKEWVAGVAGGGSGINVFISFTNLDTDKIVIDSIFFRGQKAKVEIKNSLFIGRFKTAINQQPDIIISSDTNAEYGNKAPIKTTKISFELKDNEAIISYKEKGKIKYYKQELQREEPDLYP